MKDLKLKEKTNDELKDEIIYSNKKQLSYIKESSFLIIFNSILTAKERLDKSSELDNIRDSLEFKLINDYLFQIVDLTKEIIESGLKEIKEDKIEDLYASREKIQELSSIVEGYYRELNYMGMLIDHYTVKQLAEIDYKDSHYNKKAVYELIETIKMKLDNVRGDYNKYTNIISQVISTLPMRLVKENYYNVVKNSIYRNFSKSTRYEVEKKIRDYKKIFDSSMFDGYGTKFDYYFREIQSLRNMELTDKGHDDLRDILDNTIALSDELLFIYNLLIDLGISVNMLIVIKLIGEDLNSVEIEEIYRDWKELLTSKSKIDDFIEKVKGKIESIEMKMYNDLKSFYGLNREALEREDFNYDEINLELQRTKGILTYYNDTDFTSEEILFLDNENIVTTSFLEQACDSLIKYINRALTGMGNLERKIRMRNLLSSIELPFSGIGEFFDYIEYSLDIKVSSKEIINFIIDYIYYILDEVKD